MEKELVVFWRLRDSTRCAVLHDALGGWQLRVIRGCEPPLLIERFSDPHALLARALELRAAYDRQAA
jgi:hypothetical protein